jgi:hypothetical protein
LEKNLQSLSEETQFPTLNNLTNDSESKYFLRTSSKEHCGLNFQCNSDGVTVLCKRGNASGEYTSIEATTCWENKQIWIFENGNNVPVRYQEELAVGKSGKIVHLVEQVVGNMMAMRVNKACINTGVHMIGMKLTNDGIVMVFPAVSREATGLDSAWHFIDFMLNSPEASKGCTKIPKLPAATTEIKTEPHCKSSAGSKGTQGAGKGQAAGKGKENKPTTTRIIGSGGKRASLSRGLSERPTSAQNVVVSLRTKPPSKRVAAAASSGPSTIGAKIQYLHKLQESEDRVVWRAQRRETASDALVEVVIKWYRTEPEYIWRYHNEVACYQQATSMQVSFHGFPLD